MTRLVVLDPERFLPARPIEPLDIGTGFTDSDVISVALPDFPLDSVTLAKSFIDFTSNPEAQFDLGPTGSVSFSESTTTLVNGDSELRFPRALLSLKQSGALLPSEITIPSLDTFGSEAPRPLIDMTQVTAVRFRITTTDSCTVKIMAIRLLSADWKLAPLDINTLYDRAEHPVSLTGSPTEEIAFPATPTQFPVLWRSDEPTGPLDPTPVNLDVSVNFVSGSFAETTTGVYPLQNSFSLYFREQQASYLTQLDLDGTFTQADLDLLGHQPDYGRASFDQRQQSSLEPLTQGDLNFSKQFDLERQPDNTNTVWLKMTFSWGTDSASIDIRDTENNGYTLSVPSLDANEYYYLLSELRDDELQVRIYQASYLGDIGALVFDTGVIRDDTLMVRRQGRFGWTASLLDGDAFIYNVRTRGASFAEYRSAPFQSATPVSGANLFIGGTLYRELYDGISKSPWGGQIDLDPNKAASGKAIKVTNLKTLPLQGVTTNEIEYDDFEETIIDFNMWFPKASLDAGAKLEAFLLGENIRLVPLHLGKIKTDQWFPVHLNLTEGRYVQTGKYRLVLLQTVANVPTVWWLDQISIRTRVTRWDARSHQGGAWGMDDPGWTPFLETVNSTNSGVVFAERGSSLQIRGAARRQGARIGSIKATPHYAELGNFVWQEDKDAQVYTTPTASISYVQTGSSFVFTGASPTAVLYRWDFGNGVEDYGVTVNQTFAYIGQHSVTLTTMDAQGQQLSTSAIVETV